MEGTADELKLIKHIVLLFAYIHNEYLLECLWPDKFPFNLVSPTKKKSFKIWVWDDKLVVL